MARNTCSLIAAPCSVGDMPSSPSPQLPKDEENSLLRFRSRQPQRVQRPHLSPSAADLHLLEAGFFASSDAVLMRTTASLAAAFLSTLQSGQFA